MTPNLPWDENEKAVPLTTEAWLATLQSATTEDNLLEAAQQLAPLQDKRATAILLTRLHQTRTMWLRAHLVGALVALGDASASSTLLEVFCTSHESPQVRAEAAFGLGLWLERRAAGPLLQALAVEAPPLARICATALGRIRDPRAIRPLIAALGAADEFLPRLAAEALGNYGAAATLALPTLRQLVAQGNALERQYAARAIIKIEHNLPIFDNAFFQTAD